MIRPAAVRYGAHVSFDVILFMPAPFTDHPSFPEALIARSLERAGFSVGVIEQPHWQSADDFARCGRPGLFAGIVPGPVDSVALNFTSTGKRRNEDLYQPEGNAYFPDMPPSVSSRIRPDRTLTVFASRIREALGPVPLVIGGLEASLRRFAHWDFQQQAIRRPILLDTRADLVVSGMGELQIVEIARAAARGEILSDADIPGTVRIAKTCPDNPVLLPDAAAVADTPSLLLTQYLDEHRAIREGRPVVQPAGGRFVVSQPPMVYSREDLDAIYGMPFTRAHGWMRDTRPTEGAPTPALLMNRFSVTTHRGCAGGCAFCSIAAHQGRGVVSRSRASILNEIGAMQRHPDWRGVIGDVGGASAEMWEADCARCQRASCLSPGLCTHYPAPGAQAWQSLLKEIRSLDGIRQVNLGSGVRYEVLLENPSLLEDLLRHHSGQFLRIAPEHTEDHILSLMKKPPFAVFERFVHLFETIVRRLPRPIRLAPYLIVGHPGETAGDVVRMRDKLKALGLFGQADVQIFTPTPGSLATAMYCSGQDEHGHTIAVERNMVELVRRQRMLIDSEKSERKPGAPRLDAGRDAPKHGKRKDAPRGGKRFTR
ncbi:MAG TPA: YgiQ family radical SAM protein [Spirochaetota bacterium]|nr:YgiQ family radical SAM protein [Spirochaetota bacterium]